MESRILPGSPVVLVPVLLLGTAVLLGLGIGEQGPEVAVIVPLAVIGFAVVLRPMWGLIAMLFLVPFEDIILLGGTSSITKVLGVVVAGAWLLQKLIRGERWKPLLHSGLFVGGLLFLAFSASSRLWATYTDGFTIGILRLGMLFIFSIIVLDLIRTSAHAEWAVRALVLGGILAASLTMHEYFLGGVRRAGDMVSSGPNSVALLLVSILPFSFYLMRSADRYRWQILALVYLALTVLAVALSLSRMSLLMLPLVVLAGLYETLRSGRGVVSLLVATAVGALLLVRFVPVEELKSRAETIGPYIESTFDPEDHGVVESSSRGYHLKMAVEIFKDHPIVGAGHNNFGQYSLRYQFKIPGAPKFYETPRGEHSTYLGIMANLGLVGLAIWLGLLWYAFRRLVKAWQMLSDEHRDSWRFLLVQAIAVSLAVQCVYGFYDDMQMEKLFWLMLGFSVAVPSLVGLGAVQTEEHGGDTGTAGRMSRETSMIAASTPGNG